MAALTLTVAAVSAESPRLSLKPSVALAAPGDTLEVRVQVEAGSRALTSAGACLLFDPDAFALVPAAPLPGGSTVPFEAGEFLPGQVYENAVVGEDAQWVTVSFAMVSGVGPDGHRPVGTGTGTLAIVRLAVTGYPAAGVGRIWLADEGEGRATYTELSRPGVGQPFAVADPNPMVIPISGQGLVPLPDMDLLAGEAWTTDLRPHLLGAGQEVTWQAESSDADVMSATVSGALLSLLAPLGAQGWVTVRYTARAGGEVEWAGAFSVRVIAGPRCLAGGVIELVEGQPVTIVDLSRFAMGDIPRDTRWDASGGEPVQVWVQGSDLYLNSPANWAGSTDLVLVLRQGESLLDSATVTVQVAPVNDPPRVDSPPTLVVVQGTRAAGPVLGEVVSDPDDEYAGLSLSATGDARVEAWIQEGRLWVRGLSPGTGTVLLSAQDPHGARAQAEMRVTVLAPRQAPVLSPPSEVRVAVGEEFSLVLADLVMDADDALEDLSISVEASGPIAALLGHGELAIAGLSPGAGQVGISARDPSGNAATALIAVLVVDGSMPVPAPPSPAPPEEPQLPGPTDVEEPPPPSLRVGPLPRVVMMPGETRYLSLQEYVEGDDQAVAWSVAGAAFLRVEVGPGGEVSILAPDDRSGREILVFTATGAAGGRATASQTVRVLEGAWPLEFRQVPPLEMEMGERRTLDPAAFLAAAAGPVQWGVTGTGLVTARLEPGTGLVPGTSLVLEAVATGTGELLLTATDALGQRASELLRVRVTGPPTEAEVPPAQVLELIPLEEPIRVEAGTGLRVLLDPLVRAGSAAQVAWQVTAAAPGLAAVDPESRVLLLDPAATAPGEYEVVLRAALDSQTATLTVLVSVAAVGWILDSSAALEIVAGQREVIYPLDGLVVVGDPGAVAWQVSGGLLVTARIVPETRTLVLDAGHGVVGREVFRLEARSGTWHEEATLEVLVAAPELTLMALPALTASPGDTVSLELAPYLVGDVAVEEVTWRLSGVEGVGAWMGAGGVLSLSVSSDAEIEVIAETNWGTVAYGAVSVTIQEPDSGDHTPPNTDSGPADSPTPQAAKELNLPGLLALEEGRARVLLADLVPAGVGHGATWQAVAAGSGKARIEGEWLLLEGDGDFEVLLVLTAADGALYEGATLVLAFAPDTAAPRVDLRLGVEEDLGLVRIRVRADEPLADVPQVWVDSVPLIVERAAEEFVAQYRPAIDPGSGVGVAHIDAVAEDAGGNVGRASTILTYGVLRAGLSAPGLDGLLVHLPPGAAAARVWIHQAPDQGGQYIGFDRGAAPWIEVQFARAEAGNRLEHLSPSGWTAMPGRVVGGSGLWAMLDDSGVYRLAQGSASPPASMLELCAFPNPFNASISLRVVAQASGLYTVCIYDARGRLVRQLSREVRGVGVWSAVWDGRTRTGSEAASGVYLARVQGPVGGVTAKLVLVR